MIRKRIGHSFVGRRRQEQDTEKKWYVVSRIVSGMPPFRPRDEDKIYGLSEAERVRGARDEALRPEERKTVTYKVEEASAPSRRRTVSGPPKRDAYKARGR